MLDITEVLVYFRSCSVKFRCKYYFFRLSLISLKLILMLLFVTGSLYAQGVVYEKAFAVIA